MFVYKTTKRRIFESILLNNRLQHCCIAKQIWKTRTISSIFEFQSFLLHYFIYFNFVEFDFRVHILHQNDERNRKKFSLKIFKVDKFSKLSWMKSSNDQRHANCKILRISRFTKCSKEICEIKWRNFEQNFLIWIRKNSTFVDRIVNMCDFIIQQLFDSVWIAMKTWNYLKKRYLSQNWFHKWFVFNRLKQIHYSNCKNVTKYEIAYKNIFKKIIDLKITMKNAIMIKMFNNFDSIFETFLIVKNNETKKMTIFSTSTSSLLLWNKKKIE